MRIVITGGTGTIGTALVKRYYGKHEIVIVSRDPLKQQELKKEYPEVVCFLGNVAGDKLILDEAFVGADLIIHASAHDKVLFRNTRSAGIHRENYGLPFRNDLCPRPEIVEYKRSGKDFVS